MACPAVGRYVTLAIIALVSACSHSHAEIIPDEPPPPWVDRLPRTGQLCAVGFSGPTFYHTDCLKNAADNARGGLAESISVKVKAITIDISDGSSGSYDRDVFVEGSESVSETILNGSEVAAQWIDLQGQRGEPKGCFAMVCIDPAKPIDSLVKTLEEKNVPPKTVEKVREDAAAAFEELGKEESKKAGPPLGNPASDQTTPLPPPSSQP
jgi:hypothetical protein